MTLHAPAASAPLENSPDELQLDAEDKLDGALSDSHRIICLIWQGLVDRPHQEIENPFDAETLKGVLGVAIDRIAAAQVAAETIAQLRQERRDRRSKDFAVVNRA